MSDVITVMFDTKVDRVFNDGKIEPGVEIGPHCISYDARSGKILEIVLDVFGESINATFGASRALAICILGGAKYVVAECEKEARKHLEERGVDFNKLRNDAMDDRIRKELKSGT